VSAEPATVGEDESGPYAGQNETVVAKRYRLATESRLPEFDLGGAEAYVVHDDRAPDEVLFARVLPADAQARLTVMNNLRHMREAKVLQPLDWGPVRVPGLAEQRLAVVFRRPHGALLMPSWKATISPLSADDIARRVLGPALLTLGFLGQRGLTHRSIRPDNIYWEGESRSSVLLGDCVSGAPASSQPSVFETIESAMTPSVARGNGSMVDDFYSLGVTLLVLSVGHCPVAQLSNDRILAAKLQKGSYTALMNGERPPFGLRELLRGLLSDDAGERWGLEELEQWLGGGLRSSVQEVRKAVADRPFHFAGRDYANTRALADGFGRNWKEAAAAIRGDAMAKWLRRGMGAADLADDIAGVAQAHAGSKDDDAMMVSRVCMLLDRTGPMRYKELVAMPSALGSLLATAFHAGDRERIQLVAESISKGIAIDWFLTQTGRTQTLLEDEMKETKSAQGLLRHTGPGYGIERLLYHLNPAVPCRSALLGGTYVDNIRDLLPILDRTVEKRGGLDPLVDRHLTAFIAARIKGQIDRVLSRIEASNGDPMEMKLGLLRLFAKLQQSYGPEELPYLTQWLSTELEPATQRIKGRSMREELRKRLVAVGNSGSLVQLNAYLNNETMLRRDEGGRRQAQKEFTAAAREIAQLESHEFMESAQRLGWRIASGISGTVSAAAIAIVVMV
jgi:hypothetical protein